MNHVVKFFGILLLLLCSEASYAQIGIGVINDPDGYTNIRAGKSSKSEIVGRITENEEFEYVVNSSNWYWVTTLKGNQGFVHKSRISQSREGIISRNKIYSSDKFRISTKQLTKENLLVLTIHVYPKSEEPNYDRSVISGCTALVRTYVLDKQVWVREYYNIGPVGWCAGVSFPEQQPDGGFIYGCKYGDYDGDLIQVSLSGKIRTFNGGNFLYSPDNKYLITNFASDLSGITILDIESGESLISRELDFYPWKWYAQEGRIYILASSWNGEETELYELSLPSGNTTRVNKQRENPEEMTQLRMVDKYPEKKNCVCN